MYSKIIVLALLAVAQVTSAAAVGPQRLAGRAADALAEAEAFPRTRKTTTATSTPTKSTRTTSSTATSTASDAAYIKILLKQHNVHRKNHSAPAVTWNQDLADTAAQIASSCNFAHNVTAGGGGYGQNIEAGTPAADVAAVVTNEWYDSEVTAFAPYYGEANPKTNFYKWGHFTQVVWKSTTSIGCATQYCPKGIGGLGNGVRPYFTVCNYKPPGNYANQYAKNVGKPIGLRNIVING